MLNQQLKLITFLLLSINVLCQGGSCQNQYQCYPGNCCSIWGFCGTGDAYCARKDSDLPAGRCNSQDDCDAESLIRKEPLYCSNYNWCRSCNYDRYFLQGVLTYCLNNDCSNCYNSYQKQGL